MRDKTNGLTKQPKSGHSTMKKLIIPVLLALILIPAVGFNLKKEVKFTGKTMGTSYNIKVVAPYFKPTGKLHGLIELELGKINRSMSTYDKKSEISLFNALGDDSDFPVSQGFYEVLKVAEKLHGQTEGAWDGTVGPLVNLWGFGRKGPRKEVPSPAEIASAKADVGFHNLVVGDGSIRKLNPGVRLDLASIAKGYGVDRVARVIGDFGIEDALVEIGGEIFAAGKRKDGTSWRVGVNDPTPGLSAGRIHKVLPLSGAALATSGDYRNFFMYEGVRYSHVIDPRTGFPVSNGVVSASVIAGTCTLADGLATALMVMGPEKGVALVNRMEGVECLIITENGDGTFTDHPSKGFEAL